MFLILAAMAALFTAAAPCAGHERPAAEVGAVYRIVPKGVRIVAEKAGR